MLSLSANHMPVLYSVCAQCTGNTFKINIINKLDCSVARSRKCIPWVNRTRKTCYIYIRICLKAPQTFSNRFHTKAIL